MKAMILCAGYGTRLGKLTQEIPKPMLPIAGKPLLEYIIRNLANSGFNQLAINLHYKPEMIKDYFKDGTKWDVEITYSYEQVLLGTGGGIKKMEDFLAQDELFLVHYGDILTDQDYMAMLKYHKSKQALATLLLHKRVKSNSVVNMDHTGLITTFIERPQDAKDMEVESTWVNSGVHICCSDIFKYIPQDQPFDLPRDLFSKVFASTKLYGYPLDGYRCAIDSPHRYKMAQNAVSNGSYSGILKPGDVK